MPVMPFAASSFVMLSMKPGPAGAAGIGGGAAPGAAATGTAATGSASMTAGAGSGTVMTPGQRGQRTCWPAYSSLTAHCWPQLGHVNVSGMTTSPANERGAHRELRQRQTSESTLFVLRRRIKKFLVFLRYFEAVELAQPFLDFRL